MRVLINSRQYPPCKRWRVIVVDSHGDHYETDIDGEQPEPEDVYRLWQDEPERFRCLITIRL